MHGGHHQVLRSAYAPPPCLDQPTAYSMAEVARTRLDVRFGSLADICGGKGHARFAPNSDRKSGFPQTVMSALPPKADMCSALAHVCFGPKADITDHCRMTGGGVHVPCRSAPAQLGWAQRDLVIEILVAPLLVLIGHAEKTEIIVIAYILRQRARVLAHVPFARA